MGALSVTSGLVMSCALWIGVEAARSSGIAACQLDLSANGPDLSVYFSANITKIPVISVPLAWNVNGAAPGPCGLYLETCVEACGCAGSQWAYLLQVSGKWTPVCKARGGNATLGKYPGSGPDSRALSFQGPAPNKGSEESNPILVLSMRDGDKQPEYAGFQESEEMTSLSAPSILQSDDRESATTVDSTTSGSFSKLTETSAADADISSSQAPSTTTASNLHFLDLEAKNLDEYAGSNPDVRTESSEVAQSSESSPDARTESSDSAAASESSPDARAQQQSRSGPDFGLEAVNDGEDKEEFGLEATKKPSVGKASKSGEPTFGLEAVKKSDKDEQFGLEATRGPTVSKGGAKSKGTSTAPASSTAPPLLLGTKVSNASHNSNSTEEAGFIHQINTWRSKYFTVLGFFIAFLIVFVVVVLALYLRLRKARNSSYIWGGHTPTMAHSLSAFGEDRQPLTPVGAGGTTATFRYGATK